jgi:hypothetical protein
MVGDGGGGKGLNVGRLAIAIDKWNLAPIFHVIACRRPGFVRAAGSSLQYGGDQLDPW